jgi:hypothetical protein
MFPEQLSNLQSFVLTFVRRHFSYFSCASDYHMLFVPECFLFSLNCCRTDGPMQEYACGRVYLLVLYLGVLPPVECSIESFL